MPGEPQAEFWRGEVEPGQVSGAAVAVGPVIGGALVGAAGWRAVFLVNVPITVLVLVLTAGRAGLAYALLLSAVVCAGAGAWFARPASRQA